MYKDEWKSVLGIFQIALIRRFIAGQHLCRGQAMDDFKYICDAQHYKVILYVRWR